LAASAVLASGVRQRGLVPKPHAGARDLHSHPPFSIGAAAACLLAFCDEPGNVATITTFLYRERQFFVAQRILKRSTTARAREARGMPLSIDFNPDVRNQSADLKST
jgi:hypothetical protein